MLRLVETNKTSIVLEVEPVSQSQSHFASGLCFLASIFFFPELWIHSIFTTAFALWQKWIYPYKKIYSIEMDLYLYYSTLVDGSLISFPTELSKM